MQEAEAARNAAVNKFWDLSFVERRAALHLAQLAEKEPDMAVPTDSIQGLILSLTVPYLGFCYVCSEEMLS